MSQLFAVNMSYFFSNVVNKQVELGVWHKRLGHASTSELRDIAIVPKSSYCKEMCLTCPMAKSAKLPYDLSESPAVESFDLLHIDIWGAYRVAAHDKYRYFLTVVDYHSRSAWVYLLQYKSQALSVLQKFWQYVNTHCGKLIKAVRLDNALDFDSGSCEEFCLSMK